MITFRGNRGNRDSSVHIQIDSNEDGKFKVKHVKGQSRASVALKACFCGSMGSVGLIAVIILAALNKVDYLPQKQKGFFLDLKDFNSDSSLFGQKGNLVKVNQRSSEAKDCLQEAQKYCSFSSRASSLFSRMVPVAQVTQQLALCSSLRPAIVPEVVYAQSQNLWASYVNESSYNKIIEQSGEILKRVTTLSRLFQFPPGKEEFDADEFSPGEFHDEDIRKLMRAISAEFPELYKLLENELAGLGGKGFGVTRIEFCDLHPESTIGLSSTFATHIHGYKEKAGVISFVEGGRSTAFLNQSTHALLLRPLSFPWNEWEEGEEGRPDTSFVYPCGSDPVQLVESNRPSWVYFHANVPHSGFPPTRPAQTPPLRITLRIAKYK